MTVNPPSDETRAPLDDIVQWLIDNEFIEEGFTSSKAIVDEYLSQKHDVRKFKVQP